MLEYKRGQVRSIHTWMHALDEMRAIRQREIWEWKNIDDMGVWATASRGRNESGMGYHTYILST